MGLTLAAAETGCSSEIEGLQVVVVDRSPLFAAALASILSAPPLDAKVRWHSRSDEALASLDQDPVDLILCEVNAQPISGPNMVPLLADQPSSPKLILLAGDDEDRLLFASLGSGAKGYFSKDTAPEDFIAGVEAVLHGNDVVGETIARAGFGAQGRPRELGTSGKLSPAERGILMLLGEARSIPDIASVQGISQKTVRNHLASIYRKLRLRSRAEAIVYAARFGLVNLDPQADPRSSPAPGPSWPGT